MASVFSISKPAQFEDGSELHEITLVLNKHDRNHNGRDLMEEIQHLIRRWNEEIYGTYKNSES